MKKALILSLSLAVIFGLAGCTEEKTTNEETTTPEIKLEVKKTNEKPVMVLGESLPGKNPINAAGNARNLSDDVTKSMEDMLNDMDQ